MRKTKQSQVSRVCVCVSVVVVEEVGGTGGLPLCHRMFWSNICLHSQAEAGSGGGGVIGRQQDKESSTKVIKDRKRKTEREGNERAID